MKEIIIRQYTVVDHSTKGYFITKIPDDAIIIGFNYPKVYCYMPNEKLPRKITDWRHDLCGTGRAMYSSLEQSTKITIKYPAQSRDYQRVEPRAQAKEFTKHQKTCKACRETYKDITGAVEYWDTHDEYYFEPWRKCPKCKGKGCKKCKDLPGSVGTIYHTPKKDDFRLD